MTRKEVFKKEEIYEQIITKTTGKQVIKWQLVPRTCNFPLVINRLVAKSCLTLCNPMDSSPPGSSVFETSKARILEWVAISFFRGIFSIKGSNPCLLY